MPREVWPIPATTARLFCLMGAKTCRCLYYTGVGELWCVTAVLPGPAPAVFKPMDATSQVEHCQGPPDFRRKRRVA
jgi:hypothetical protein